MMTLYFRKFDEQNIHFQVEEKAHQDSKNPNKKIGAFIFLLILAMTTWALSEERERKLAEGLAKIHREH